MVPLKLSETGTAPAGAIQASAISSRLGQRYQKALEYAVFGLMFGFKSPGIKR